MIADDTFAITPTVGRYITVDITSYYGSSGGLNEVEVFGTPAGSAVPEPASWALMIAGFGAAGFGLRGARRQRAVA